MSLLSARLCLAPGPPVPPASPAHRWSAASTGTGMARSRLPSAGPLDSLERMTSDGGCRCLIVSSYALAACFAVGAGSTAR